MSSEMVVVLWLLALDCWFDKTVILGPLAQGTWLYLIFLMMLLQAMIIPITERIHHISPQQVNFSGAFPVTMEW